MEIKIGKRSAYFCNLKVFLIILVVYGHFIESRIQENDFLMWQYRFIYSVHMPLFAFLSGVFLKGKKSCLQQLKNAFTYYLIFQSIYILIAKMVLETSASYKEPLWHLWYLLSLGCWAGICLILEALDKYLDKPWKKGLIIVASIGIACAAGYVEEINRALSLSRTIVFLPYVLLGKYFPLDTEIKRFRIAGICIGIFSVGMVIVFEKIIPISFLYHAESYHIKGVEHGEALRLLCFVIGIGLGVLILVLIPQRRLAISKIGANTLWIYLLHVPLVLFFQETKLDGKEFVYVAMFITVSIVLFLYKGTQWKSKLYRIV